MTAIAKTSIVMSLNASQMTTGLRAVASQVQGFGAGLGKVAGMATAATGLLAGAAGVAGLVAWANATREQIDRLEKLNISTGISVANLSALGYAAGLAGTDLETVAGAVGIMQKNLVKLEDKDAGIFEKLGLDAGKLKAMKPDEAMGEIAEAINALPTAADRASAAMTVFGKSGKELLPMLSGGRQGLKDMADEAKAFGVVVDDAAAVKVAAMNDSLSRLQQAGQGAINQLVVEMSPAITEVATLVAEWLKETPVLVEGVRVGFHMVEAGITTVAELVDYLAKGMGNFQLLAENAAAAAVRGFGKIIDVINALLDSEAGKKLFGGARINFDAEGVASQIDRQAATTRRALDEMAANPLSEQVSRWFENARNKADALATSAAHARNQIGSIGEGAEAQAKKVDDQLKAMAKSIAQFNMTAGQKTVSDLAAAGATPEQLSAARAMQAHLEGLNALKERGKQLDDDAKRVLDSIQTPAQKAQAEVDRLTTLLDAGKLSWDQYAAALNKVKAESLTPAAKDIAAPELFEAGSDSARRLMFNLQRQTGLDKNPNLALEKGQQEQTAVLRGIDKKLAAGPASKTVSVKL